MMQADKNEWPWTALILRKDDPSLTITCAGALLNSKWVLAVKKCVSAVANINTNTNTNTPPKPITKLKDMVPKIEVRKSFIY